MRVAAARAASRRGSSTMIFLPRAHGSLARTSGTRVDLPAPGGATRTATLRATSAAVSSGNTASMGRLWSNSIPDVPAPTLSNSPLLLVLAFTRIDSSGNPIFFARYLGPALEHKAPRLSCDAARADSLPPCGAGESHVGLE